MATSHDRVPPMPEQDVLEHLSIRLIDPDDVIERDRYRALIEKHHYLKNDTLVGEQLRYMAEVDGRWLAAAAITSRTVRIGSAGTTHNADDQIGIAGKTQRGSAPLVRGEQKLQLVSAQSLPSGHVIGTVGVKDQARRSFLLFAREQNVSDNFLERPCQRRCATGRDPRRRGVCKAIPSPCPATRHEGCALLRILSSGCQSQT